jgi:hypothetical protein
LSAEEKAGVCEEVGEPAVGEPEVEAVVEAAVESLEAAAVSSYVNV